MRELVSFIVRAAATCVVAWGAFTFAAGALYDEQRFAALVAGNVAIIMGLWGAWSAGRAAGEAGMTRLIAKVGARLGQIRLTINQGRSDD